MTYYNLLNDINKYVCNENSKLRKETSPYLEIIFNSINKTLYNSQNDNEIITNAMQTAAYVKLYQPFHDGNHRTGLILFGYLLTQKGFDFDYENALNDMDNKKLNIPTIYEEKDSVENFDTWYKYISKVNMKYPKI